MFRALLYGSYKKPRELLWLSGMGIYLLLTIKRGDEKLPKHKLIHEE